MGFLSRLALSVVGGVAFGLIGFWVWALIIAWQERLRRLA